MHGHSVDMNPDEGQLGLALLFMRPSPLISCVPFRTCLLTSVGLFLLVVCAQWICLISHSVLWLVWAHLAKYTTCATRWLVRYGCSLSSCLVVCMFLLLPFSLTFVFFSFFSYRVNAFAGFCREKHFQATYCPTRLCVHGMLELSSVMLLIRSCLPSSPLVLFFHLPRTIFLLLLLLLID